MKRIISIILLLMFVFGLSVTAYAASSKTAADFDPSEYTVDDLLLIDKAIWEAIPKTPTGEVLYDDKGIYIEYKGIYEYSKSSWIVDLYIENNTEEDVYVTLMNGRCNRFDTGFSNNGNKIIADSVYRASAKYQFIIDIDDLKIYDIDHLNSVDFNLDISTAWIGGDQIANVPVKLVVDMDLP